MMRPRPRPPLWAEIVYFALAALLLRWVCLHLPAAPHAGALEQTPVALGFFGAFIAVVEAIWAGVQAFGQATLAALAYTVHFLWAAISRMGSWALELGRDTIKGFRAAWSFVRTLYDDVLKPAWQKFWKFVDWARHSLEHLFGPIVRFLRRVRKWMLDYYDQYVRPVLDTIEVARKVLQLLAHLGVGWAKTLDEKLAAFQSWVYDQFYKVWSKVNEAIALVDRVVTVDGLFQRLALVRSITRDFAVIGDEWARVHKKPATPEELEAARKRKYPRGDPKVLGEELAKFYSGADSKYAGIIAELVPEWRRAAGRAGASV